MSLNEPLVAIESKGRLKVEPIWEYPVDDIEPALYQEYIASHPNYTKVLARAAVAGMLLTAADSLPAEYRLILRAAHRPLDVQLKLLQMVKQTYLDDHPQADDDEALAFARTYVSDPSIKLPPHCSGAAVDVDMEYLATGELVDFGCPMNTDDDIAFLDTEKINDTQRMNRTMLVVAMVGAGFATNPNEWWHFSYGDQRWADTYGHSEPLYGIVEA